MIGVRTSTGRAVRDQLHGDLLADCCRQLPSEPVVNCVPGVEGESTTALANRKEPTGTSIAFSSLQCFAALWTFDH
jgi:hypothetical protein